MPDKSGGNESVRENGVESRKQIREG